MAKRARPGEPHRSLWRTPAFVQLPCRIRAPTLTRKPLLLLPSVPSSANRVLERFRSQCAS